uniref:Uncharacterized protein n=1 Tax=Glossina austeni TaxID=7395 RepID=A0A1A9UWD8_GLOAU
MGQYLCPYPQPVSLCPKIQLRTIIRIPLCYFPYLPACLVWIVLLVRAVMAFLKVSILGGFFIGQLVDRLPYKLLFGSIILYHIK